MLIFTGPRRHQIVTRTHPPGSVWSEQDLQLVCGQRRCQQTLYTFVYFPNSLRGFKTYLFIVSPDLLWALLVQSLMGALCYYKVCSMILIFQDHFQQALSALVILYGGTQNILSCLTLWDMPPMLSSNVYVSGFSSPVCSHRTLSPRRVRRREKLSLALEGHGTLM